jgi:hypothetical protein
MPGVSYGLCPSQAVARASANCFLASPHTGRYASDPLRPSISSRGVTLRFVRVKKTLQFVAMVLTALALVPSGAHLFALPNKIHLSETDYFITQGIYRGWSLCDTGNLFCFHVSGQSGNEQLDGNTCQLGAITLAMGAFA